MFLGLLKKKIKESIYSKRSSVVKKLNIKFNLNRNLKYHIYSFGNKYPNKKFYIIQRYIGGGMFSNLNYVIHHISLALELGCIPIIDMKNFEIPENFSWLKNIANGITYTHT